MRRSLERRMREANLVAASPESKLQRLARILTTVRGKWPASAPQEVSKWRNMSRPGDAGLQVRLASTQLTSSGGRVAR